LSLCLIKYHATKTYRGSADIATTILNLVTRRKLVVNFTPQPFYPGGKRSQYPLDRRLIGPQSRSGHGGEATRC
jgi:hypothetical protein